MVEEGWILVRQKSITKLAKCSMLVQRVSFRFWEGLLNEARCSVGDFQLQNKFRIVNQWFSGGLFHKPYVRNKIKLIAIYLFTHVVQVSITTFES